MPLLLRGGCESCPRRDIRPFESTDQLGENVEVRESDSSESEDSHDSHDHKRSLVREMHAWSVSEQTFILLSVW